jgi:hypothetical protein
MLLPTIRNASAVLLFVFAPAMVWGQLPTAPEPKIPPQAHPGEQAKQDKQAGKTETAPSQANSETQTAETDAADAPVQSTNQKKQKSELKQTKRILWIAPNFGAVSPGAELPALTTKQKFKLARQDSFDYSSFVWTGILAAQSMALRQYPEFGDGMAAYGRYYWRGFLDGTSGTYFTEAIVPTLTHEDPRYFTLGHGGFLRRFGYALSRTALTRTDSGGTAFNWSELGGNGAEAALSNLYYPPEERGVTKTMENWGAQMESAALNNIAKEFWPDFRRDVLRMK